MFIETETTPNPATLKFMPGRPVMGDDGTRDFASPEDAEISPLAEMLFALGDVTGVFFGKDFVSVTAAPGVQWADLKPQVVAVLLDHFVTKTPLFKPGATGGNGIAVPPEDDGGIEIEDDPADADIVAQIKELLDTRVRPAVAGDGGDIGNALVASLQQAIKKYS